MSLPNPDLYVTVKLPWDVVRRFEKYCRRAGPNDCWSWSGGKSRHGYGRLSIAAHRLAYELFVGMIPDGLVVDHLCRNPECVNPAHLEAVTGQENSWRSPVYIGNRTHCVRGHRLAGNNIYAASRRRNGKHSGERICRICRFEKYRAKRRLGLALRRGKGWVDTGRPLPRLRPWTRWTQERTDEFIRRWSAGEHPATIGSAMGLTIGAVYGQVTKLRQQGLLLPKRKLGRPPRPK